MKNLHLSIVGEKPVVVVLREGDLTQEEADRLEAGTTGQCTIKTAHGVEGGGPHPEADRLEAGNTGQCTIQEIYRR